MRVIIPPPEIKTVIDKTASYVAKNGQGFEMLILKTEQNNPKFNFLRHADDPYRPYYMQKINELLPQKPVAEEEDKMQGQGEGEEQLNGGDLTTAGVAGGV